MATISQVRAGIRTRLLTIAAFDGKVYEKMRGDITPPAAIVLPAPGTFLVYRTSTGSDDLQLNVRVFASHAHEDTGQDVLDAFIDRTGASSVYAAIDADPTLGGIVDYAVVTGATDYGSLTVGALELFGCDFVIDVAMS